MELEMEVEVEVEVGRQSSSLPKGERKVLEQRAGRRGFTGSGTSCMARMRPFKAFWMQISERAL